MTRRRVELWPGLCRGVRFRDPACQGARFLAAIFVGVLLLAGGCSSAGDEAKGQVSAENSSDPSNDEQSAVSEDGASEDGASEDGASEDDADGEGVDKDESTYRSPIQVFFDQSPYNEDRHRETEELIFVCMKGEGFDYAITEFEPPDSVPAGLPDAAPVFGTVDFAERYGFAISTTAFSQTTVGADLLGHEPRARPQLVESADPYSDLDAAGKEAYGRALFGKPASGGEDFSQGGCLGEAQRASEEDDPYYDFLVEFEKEFDALQEAIRQDPRLTELEDNTLACIAATGYDPQTIQEETIASVRLMNEAHLFDALQISSEELVALGLEEYWDAWEIVASHPLSDQLREDLAALQAKEIEAATAIAGCEDYKARELMYFEVTTEYEERFLADNAERLRLYQAEPEVSE